MINLLLVGYGNKTKIKEMINTTQNLINLFCSENNANIYDLDSLWKFENNLEQFKKQKKLRFSSKNTVFKEYWGILNCKNYESLHSRLFSSCKEDNIFLDKEIYYSNSNFAILIDKLFSKTFTQDNYYIYDFSIKQRFDTLTNNNAFCIIEWCVNIPKEDFVIPHFLEWFQKIINLLDCDFDDVFSSAYISNYNMCSTLHLDLYNNFDFDMLSTHILGVEYSFYVRNTIYSNNKNILNSIDYTSIKLKNGYQYISNVCLNEFDSKVRKKSEPLLYNLLIPAYSVHNWSNLCNLKRCYAEKPEIISIYYDKFSPTDPTVIFSFGLKNYEIASLPMLTGNNLLKRWEKAEKTGDNSVS